MSDQPGSTPLKNRRWETYCQALSRAQPPSAQGAWQEACEAAGKAPPVDASAKVTASNLLKREVISNRITYLRQQRISNGLSEAAQGFTERDLNDLLGQCSATMIKACKAAERAGLGASQLSAMRKVIVTHEGRRKRSGAIVQAPKEETPHVILNIPHWCVCGAKNG